MSIYIPAKTVDKINGSHPEGTRHKAKMDIAISLLGNGMAAEAVCAQLRSTFPNASDKEIEGVVRWAEGNHPSPSGNGETFKARPFVRTPRPLQQAEKAKSPSEHCAWWLNGAEIDAESLSQSSPVTIPAVEVDALKLFFESLYFPEDSLNIVTKFVLDEKKGKANPDGMGKTLPRDQWLDWFSERGIPQSEAGAWLRMNPVSVAGISDADVTAFRYLLVESDTLTLPFQQALYSRLPLPVVAIFSSGGKSVHAWVRLESATLEAFKEQAARLLKTLAPFGIDESNKNASRLSRLPFSTRKIGAMGDGLQCLLWLNPKAVAWTDENFPALDDALKFPVIEDRPFRKVFLAAIDRYDDLVANRGRNGILTGLYSFDRDSGGLKKGQMTVISAETNGGKTSIAMNFVNAALSAKHGVLLFTLEMDRDEICDMLMAMNCRVNRSHFNTGNFTEGELKSVAARSAWFVGLPLWVEDAPAMTVSTIRARTMQLVREKKIGLVVVDYIQFVSPEFQQEPREQQIAGISRALRSLAKEAQVPIVVLSQLNDDGKLRESRVIGHDAHIVANVDNILENPSLNVVKGRSIPKNRHEFIFEPEFCLVKNPSRIQDADIPRNNRTPHAD